MNTYNEDLVILTLDSIKKFGEKVGVGISSIRKDTTNYIVPLNMVRFSNGEGKVKIEGSVRDKDIYIISDVGNYSMSYKFHGKEHYVSPDEHFMDIKRVISATCGHASRITVIMPLLYQSRQHKRKGMESLDCAIALQELERLGVNSIITFDAHDPSIVNAIPNTPFESFYPTQMILNKLEEEGKKEDISIVISPDMGAIERARYYADKLKKDVGVFYKRRDLSILVNGKHPVVAHEYMGANVKNKTALVVDDMIASGGSMIEVAQKLKEEGSKEVYLAATFALFTEGIECFIAAHEKGYFDKLYTTNVSYVPDEIKKLDWYEEVDCSYFLAEIIDSLNTKKSIKEIIHR